MFKKSQTATEYLVILAVVIVIALVVVGVMGGIPSIGGGVSASAAKAALASQKIAVTGFAVSDYDTDLVIRNNHQSRVEIDTISINGEECLFFIGTKHVFGVGQKKTIVCQNVYEIEQDKVTWLIEINWTDLSNDASYTQSGNDLALVGDVSNEYLSKVQSNDYWNPSINGCYDNSTSINPICTCVDLNKTRLNLDKNHTLQNSIDFVRCNTEFGVDFTESNGNGGWEPIAQTGSEFAATFDGGNNIIKHLYIDTSASDSGFFGDASNVNAVIKNLGLSSVDVNGGNNVGAIVGFGYYAEISNVYVQGLVDGSGEVGGISGFLTRGNLINSFFTGTVTGSDGATGGLVAVNGLTPGFSIRNSHFYGTINSAGSYLGGLVGYNYGAETSGSSMNGRIFCTSAPCANIGAIMGHDNGDTHNLTSVTYINYTDDDIIQCVGTDASYDGNGCNAITP